MAARKLYSGHFVTLFEHLRMLCPQSLMMCNVIQTLIKNRDIGFQVWVEKWPSPTTVIVNANRNTCMFDCWKSFAIAFSTDQVSLINLLSNVVQPSLTERKTIVMPGLLPEMVSPIQTAFPNSNFRWRELEMMWMKREHISENEIRIRLPHGFQHGKMNRTTSELLVKQLDNDWAPCISAEYVFKITNKMTSPYVVILDNNNIQVGWFMKHFLLGFLSHLHVDDEYRGRGIGKYILSSLTNTVLKQDRVAFVQIMEDNLLSNRICTELGYQKVGKVTHCVITM